jgi:hypothetical protein
VDCCTQGVALTTRPARAGISNGQRLESYVDEIVAQQARPGGLNARDLFARTSGAHPAVIFERLGFRPQEFQATEALPSDDPYTPNLHALLSEWYFTPNTAADFLSIIPRRGKVICLGTPTVAAACIRRGTKAALIDASPFVVWRFPELRQTEPLLIADVSAAVSVDCAPTVVFDAPWRANEVLRWLRVASELVVRGGTVAFALFGESTRPSAGRERDEILAMAEMIGRVLVHPGAVQYTTPHFEHCALWARGIGGVGNWRHADLVTISHAHATDGSQNVGGDATCPPIHLGAWSGYARGSTVTWVRKSSMRRQVEGQVWARIPDTRRLVSPYVGLGHAERAGVDLWTSSNQVAKLMRGEAVDDVLDALPPDCVKGIPRQHLLARTAHAG